MLQTNKMSEKEVLIQHATSFTPEDLFGHNKWPVFSWMFSVALEKLCQASENNTDCVV